MCVEEKRCSIGLRCDPEARDAYPRGGSGPRPRPKLIVFSTLHEQTSRPRLAALRTSTLRKGGSRRSRKLSTPCSCMAAPAPIRKDCMGPFPRDSASCVDLARQSTPRRVLSGLFDPAQQERYSSNVLQEKIRAQFVRRAGPVSFVDIRNKCTKGVRSVLSCASTDALCGAMDVPDVVGRWMMFPIEVLGSGPVFRFLYAAHLLLRGAGGTTRGPDRRNRGAALRNKTTPPIYLPIHGFPETKKLPLPENYGTRIIFRMKSYLNKFVRTVDHQHLPAPVGLPWITSTSPRPSAYRRSPAPPRARRPRGGSLP